MCKTYWYCAEKLWKAGVLNPVQSHPYNMFREISSPNPMQIFLGDEKQANKQKMG